jgi:hypothetical protein
MPCLPSLARRGISRTVRASFWQWFWQAVGVCFLAFREGRSPGLIHFAKRYSPASERRKTVRIEGYVGRERREPCRTLAVADDASCARFVAGISFASATIAGSML